MNTKVHTHLTFAEILDDAITQSPYNHAQVAGLLNVSKGTVSNWVSGTRKPDIDMIIKICHLLDIDLYYLIGATMPEGELRASEAKLLFYYRQLNGKKKKSLLELIRVLAEDES